VNQKCKTAEAVAIEEIAAPGISDKIDASEVMDKIEGAILELDPMVWTCETRTILKFGCPRGGTDKCPLFKDTPDGFQKPIQVRRSVAEKLIL
jgi:hypothetical protein